MRLTGGAVPLMAVAVAMRERARTRQRVGFSLRQTFLRRKASHTGHRGKGENVGPGQRLPAGATLAPSSADSWGEYVACRTSAALPTTAASVPSQDASTSTTRT